VWLLVDNLDKGWPTRGTTSEDILIVRSLLDATRKLQRQLGRSRSDRRPSSRPIPSSGPSTSTDSASGCRFRNQTTETVRFSHLRCGAECVGNRFENFANLRRKPRLG
jgi:hypothetical protein